jgi:hypothetical protein
MVVLSEGASVGFGKSPASTPPAGPLSTPAGGAPQVAVVAELATMVWPAAGVPVTSTPPARLAGSMRLTVPAPDIVGTAPMGALIDSFDR